MYLNTISNAMIVDILHCGVFQCVALKVLEQQKHQAEDKMMVLEQVEAAFHYRCWHRALYNPDNPDRPNLLHVLIPDLAAGRRWKRRFWKTKFTILLYALFWILYCVPRTKNSRLIEQEHSALLRRLAEVQGGGLVRCILILNSYFPQVLKVSI